MPMRTLLRYCLCAAAIQSALATSLGVAGLVGPVKWQPGATINVYIPLDPLRNDADTPRTRNVQVQQAIDAWQKALQDAGVNLTLHGVTLDANGNVPGTGNPPDTSHDTPQSGSISINWKPVTGTGEHGDAVPSTQDPPGTNKVGPLVHDDATLDDSTTALTQKDNDQALGTALHELGHALGMDHSDESDSVMHSSLDTEPKSKIGASDIRELKAVYTASNSNLNDLVLPLPTAGFAYTVTAQWLSGGEIAMIQMLTNGAPITNLVLPAGWIEAQFPGVANPAVLTFIIDPTDALQAYLNQSQPSFTFRFDSLAAPAQTTAWAGNFQSVGGPVVPEPGSFWPAAAALLLACSAVHLTRAPKGK